MRRQILACLCESAGILGCKAVCDPVESLERTKCSCVPQSLSVYTLGKSDYTDYISGPAQERRIYSY